MQIKTTIDTTSHLPEWLLSKGQETTSIAEDAEKRGSRGTVGAPANWRRLQFQYRVLKTLKTHHSAIEQLHFWVFTPPQNKHTNLKRHMYPYVHGSTIYDSQDMEAI